MTHSPIDPRLQRWLARTFVRDDLVPWLDAGGNLGHRASLARIFTPLHARFEGDPYASAWNTVGALLDPRLESYDEDRKNLLWSSDVGPLAFVVGGPGSGKTTVTTLVAQLLREQMLPEGGFEPAEQLAIEPVRGALRTIMTSLRVTDRVDAVPVRVVLPQYARWCREAGRDASSVASIWDFVAWTIANDMLPDGSLSLDGAGAKALLESSMRPIYWLLDSLDEVPTADDARARCFALAEALVREPNTRMVVVTARPDAIDHAPNLRSVFALLPIDAQTGYELTRRLLGEVGAPASSLDTTATNMRWLEPLVRTPLHATMLATVLATGDAELLSQRHLLDAFVDITFRREAKKYKAAAGVFRQPTDTLVQLHRKLALALHTRAQHEPDARITAKALDDQLAALLASAVDDPDAIASTVTQLSEYTRERLMFLLRTDDESFSFGIRPLQEYFAAEEIRRGVDTDQLVRRIETIALHAHWRPVLAFIVSALMASSEERSRFEQAIIGVFEKLNEPHIDDATRQLASITALHIAAAVQRIEVPALQAKLWNQALAVYDDDVTLAAEYREHASRRGTTGRDASALLRVLFTQEKDRPLPRHRAEAARRASETLLRVLRDRGARAALEAMRWVTVGVGDEDSILRARDAIARQAIEEGLPPDEWLRLAMIGYPKDVPCEPIVEELKKGPERFTPGQFVRARWRWYWANQYAKVVPWVAAVRELGHEPPRSTIDRRMLGRLCVKIRRIVVDTERAARFLEHAPTSTDEWRGWRSVFEFEQTPSLDRLLAVVEATKSASFRDDVRPAYRSLSWPLHSVLRAVELSDPDIVSGQLHGGTFGDYDDWLQAEARWASTQGSFDEHVELHRAARPWSAEIAHVGEQLSDEYSLTIALTQSDTSSNPSEIDHLVPLRFDESWRVRGFAQRLLLGFAEELLLRVREPARQLDLEQARHIVTSARDSVSGLPVEQAAFDVRAAPGEWSELLDHAARQNRFFVDGSSATSESEIRERSAFAESLIEIAEGRADLGGLLIIVVGLLSYGASVRLRGRTLPNCASDRSEDVRAAWRVISVLADERAELEPSTIRALPEGYQSALVELSTRREYASPERAAAIRAAVFEHGHYALRAWIASLRLQEQRAQLEGDRPFDTSEKWGHAKFTGQFPMTSKHTAAPVKITELRELSGFRVFAATPRVSTPFAEGGPAEGQWIVLLGENGVGKTTLLRALALALVDPVVATQLLARTRSGAFRRNGVAARIDVVLNRDSRFAVGIETGERGVESIVQDGEGPRWRPWVVGYGVSRGNALGERDREVVKGAFGDVHTLFDEPPSLHRATSWLYQLRNAVSKEIEQQIKREGSIDRSKPGPAKQRWDTVCNVLRIVLGVDEIERDEHQENTIWVESKKLGRVRFDALSDGYLSFAGWTVDLIARWIDAERDEHREVREGFNLRMTGVVLIDELDMHLHPVWQMNVMDRVREVFPRMTFVVTTHNPLMLQGARPGEVYVVRRDGNDIELVQRDIAPGSDVDRVLFEQFGLLETFDKETRDMILEHRALMAQDESARDKERLAELNRALSMRLSIVAELAYEQRERALRGDPERVNEFETVGTKN